MNGARAACAAPTTTAQYASWFQRSSWPVKAMPKVNTSSTVPLSQLTSRGNLKAPIRNTCAACAHTSSTMADAPQKWMPRTMLPSTAPSVMNCRLS